MPEIAVEHHSLAHLSFVKNARRLITRVGHAFLSVSDLEKMEIVFALPLDLILNQGKSVTSGAL
jgi:hypothetical protein